MTNVEKRSLMDPVRECVSELQAQGRYTTREVVNLVQERYPDRVEAFSARLIYDGLADLVRTVNKSPIPEQNGQRHLFLPRDVMQRIPQAISLVSEGDDGDGAPCWIATDDATFAEVELHIMLLEVSVARDMKRLEAWRSVRDLLAPVMADGRQDEPIGPVLKEMGHPIPAA